MHLQEAFVAGMRPKLLRIRLRGVKVCVIAFIRCLAPSCTIRESDGQGLNPAPIFGKYNGV
jgi:hypothetical protein